MLYIYQFKNRKMPRKAKEQKEEVLKDDTTKEDATKEDTTKKVPKYNIIDNYNKDVVNGIKACVEQNESVLLIGETGLGKTTLISELAKDYKKNVIRVSINGSTGIAELIGKYQADKGTTRFQYGILIEAMQKGDWIVLDEINAALPEILFSLHQLLDDARQVTVVENGGEIIKPHKDFRLFACMNPSDDYSGTKDMNMALVSRFAGVFFIEEYSEEVEESILIKGHGINETIAIALVKLAKNLRDLKKKDDIMYFCSTRDIIQAGKLASKTGLQNACIFSIKNKMNRDDAEFSKGFFGSIAVTPGLSREELNNQNTKLKQELAELKPRTDLYKSNWEKALELVKLRDKLIDDMSNDLAELKSELDKVRGATPTSIPVRKELDPIAEKLLKELGLI